MKRVIAIAVGALTVGVFAAEPARAEERTCRGTIGATTLDNVRVPDGAKCVLQGTTVQGTVKVETNAVLVARDVRVIGNVQAEDARNVKVVQTSRVGGSVQVKQGKAAKVVNSKINADIQYDANNGLLRAIDNKVGGSIQVMQNTGGVVIRANRVDGNLQCKENSPAPTGGGNVVQGNKEDQCAGL